MLAGFVLQMIGIESVSPSVSAFLTSLYVVFTAILSVKIRIESLHDDGAGRWPGYNCAGFIDGRPILWGLGELLTVVSHFSLLYTLFTQTR